MDLSLIDLDNTPAASQMELDSILSDTTDEIENTEESVEQLLQRAEGMLEQLESFVRTKPQTIHSVVIDTTHEAQAVLDSIVEMPTSTGESEIIVDDDDVIFVGEQNNVINLCSPDPVSRSSRLPVNANNRKQRQLDSHSPARSSSNISDESSPTVNTVMCAVCMDSAVGKAPHSTNCGHIFCGACIKQSIKIMKKCPLCNKHLNMKSIFPVFL